MINVLSYLGMELRSEVCLWTLIGLMRTIFDATLFKVNDNLKQVWQMEMPVEITLPVQRVLRTMISGVMLLQCFTVYIYLASYIVLLYPVFLEERPTLVLPWLLLAAIRQLLCELTSLAIGLGTCVLVGPARPPCITFVVVKLISIMPAFYMWMLVYNFYYTLKISCAFKTFPAVLPASDHDYGLELAVRRRRTKSLLGEEQLRCSLVARLHGNRTPEVPSTKNIDFPSIIAHSANTSSEDMKIDTEYFQPTALISNHLSETGSITYDEWYGADLNVPRDTDRILEQFVLMLLKIGAYLTREGRSINSELFQETSILSTASRRNNLNCPLASDDTDAPPQVASKGNTASYVLEYPQIFMKKPPDIPRMSDGNSLQPVTVDKIKSHSVETDDSIGSIINQIKEKTRIHSPSTNEKKSTDIEKKLTRSKSCSVEQDVSTETMENKLQVKFAEDKQRRQCCDKNDCDKLKNSLRISESTESLISILNNISDFKNNMDDESSDNTKNK